MAHGGLPRAGGFLEQRQREMANFEHYLNGLNSAGDTVAPARKPTVGENKARREALLRRVEEEEEDGE